MFRAVVGQSDDIDTEDAAAEILSACDAALAGDRPLAGTLYCGTEFDHQGLVKIITDHYPGLRLIGCTTDGEMNGDGGFTEDGITLTLFCSDRVEIGIGIGQGVGSDPEAAATAAASMAKAQISGEVRLVLALPDGLSANAYRVLAGLNREFGDAVPVVGGMTADRVGGDKQTYETHQFFGDSVVDDSVAVMVFAGPLTHALGVESGWSPIGEKARVTKVDGHVLHELNGRPAFELFLHYLGDVMKENLSGLGSYPLAVYEPGQARYYLRVARSADPETGAVTFLGEIPDGAEVQITQAIRDEVLSGAEQSVCAALANYRGDAPAAAMMFSCTGRKIVLGTKVRDEVGLARKGLPANVPMSGFYTFGEIAPVADQLRSRYHNTTFVTLLMGEEA